MNIKIVSLLMAMILLCGCFTACDSSDYDSVDTHTTTSTENNEDETPTTTTTKKTTTTTKKTTTTTKKITTTKKTTTTEQMVWIPVSGSKYHSKASCSNMKNPSKVTKTRAIELGYSPCSRCY